MPPKSRIPYFSYQDISRISFDFLKKHEREGKIPIDIEAILEFELDVSIIPTPGFQQAHDVEASLSQDMKAIYIDEYVFRSRENRYRFSLAHELGHIVLHHDLFEGTVVDDIEGWKEAYQMLDSNSYALIEKQAYDFAGLLLVPAAHLKPRVARLLDENKTQFVLAERQGISKERAMEYFLARANFKLAKIFKVSTDVIDRRIDRDELIHDLAR